MNDNSTCGYPFANPLESCGKFGICINNTFCLCSYPYQNIGDLWPEVNLRCDILTPLRQASWACLGVIWLIVILYTFYVIYQIIRYVPNSRKKNIEVFLLCAKIIHSILFVATALYAIFGEKFIGIDLSITILYAVTVSLFWIEFHLYLRLPSLSNIITLAQSFAKSTTTKWISTSSCCVKFFASFFILCFCIISSCIVIDIALIRPLPGVTFQSLHLTLTGSSGFMLLLYHLLMVNEVLRRLDLVLSSSLHNNITRDSSRVLKIQAVKKQIRRLRNETVLQMSFTIIVVIGCSTEVFIKYCSYLLPFGFSVCGLITLRYIFLSHRTVYIHKKRWRSTEQATSIPRGPLSPKEATEEFDENTVSEIENPTSMTPMQKAQEAISRMAQGRKKRLPKFAIDMSRVEEEKTVATATDYNNPSNV